MSTSSRMGGRRVAHLRETGGWRTWLVHYILVSLLCPVTLMLPLAILGLGNPNIAQTTVQGHYHDEAASLDGHHGGASHHPEDAASDDHHDGVAANHHHDASDVPGSPTHPEDHNCFECQVLQHLARCVPPDFGPVVIPPQPTLFVARLQLRETLPPSHASPRPPIRGPPSLDA